jgi:hypothetical protein
MNGIGKSLFLAVVSLFSRRMIWLMIWPLLVALALWGTVAFVLWGRTVAWVVAQLARFLEPVVVWVPQDFIQVALLVSAHTMLVLLFVPLVYLTALLILGIFGMEAMVDHVAKRHYPDLVRRHGGGTVGSLWNSLVALCGLVLLFLVTLPLLLIPPLWALVPVAVMGWVNQKILRYDAIADHATAGEMAEVFRKGRRDLFFLGVLLALVAYVPLVQFFAPMVFALAFIHYCLGALRSLRGAPIEGEVVGVVPTGA